MLWFGFKNLLLSAFMRKRGQLVAASLGLSLLACEIDLPFGQSSARRTSDTAETSRTDVSLLEKYIKLPVTPRRVVWQTIPKLNDDWWLAALIEVTPSDLTYILERTQKEPGRIYLLPKHLAWLPAKLRDRYGSSLPDTNGMVAIEGQRYQADLFIDQGRSPLTMGYIGVVDPSGLIYVALSTF